MKPADAEEFTRTLATSVACGWRQIAWGQKIGIPKALGLSTRDWVQRLGGYVKLAGKDRFYAELTLKADGLNYKEIGDVIGLSDEAVRVDLANLLADGSAEPLDAAAALAAGAEVRAEAKREQCREQRDADKQSRRSAPAAAARTQPAADTDIFTQDFR